MNRCAVILLLAMLLAPAALAQDAPDAFEPDSALAVSDGRMILIGKTETATLLRLEEDGVTMARCRLEEDGSLYTPFVFADGRPAIWWNGTRTAAIRRTRSATGARAMRPACRLR